MKSCPGLGIDNAETLTLGMHPMPRAHSKRQFAKARQFMPGGVNSPVRAFGSVGGDPIFMARGRGAYLEDIDSNQYIDYVGSWGPMILGHANPHVVTPLKDAVEKSSSFGAPTVAEVDMAELVLSRMPSMQQIRLVNSGTEAVMAALRVARGFTKRNKILKFAGCYHGHSDALLVKAGSGALTHGAPDSLGVPAAFTQHTLIAPYNDLAATERLVRKHRKDLAAIIVEPIAGNMGVVLPRPGFLRGLKKLCRVNGALLIFDEVMTGFRVHSSGAQGLYGVKPDLTTLGKIIGGGLPVGAFGGPKKIMQCLSPVGGVYQAGTLSGNPLAMAAGLATLKKLGTKSFYVKLNQKTSRLALGLTEAARKAGIPVQIPHVCGMLSLFFSDQVVTGLGDVMKTRKNLYKAFFHEMLARGIYLPPSPFEAWFVSIVHGENEIAKTVRAAKDSFQNIKDQF